tara:strand:+ start:372 stop:833 length:462 start_codon:yes stop_codon:yes gene_type:complete
MTSSQQSSGSRKYLKTMKKKQPIQFEEKLNIDVIRYIFSFLDLTDYEKARLWIGDCRIEHLETKIAGFKYIYSIVQKENRTAKLLYNLKKYGVIKCDCGPNEIKDFNERKEIEDLRQMGFTIFYYRHQIITSTGIAMLWRVTLYKNVIHLDSL